MHDMEKIDQNGTTIPKPAIERGASWTFGETKILLALWGVSKRQLTNSKRTKHVWEKIAERIRENGYDRTPGLLDFILIPPCLCLLIFLCRSSSNSSF